MTMKSTLLTRIELLQMQIDEERASGETHNCFGVPMEEQIAQWEESIAECKAELKRDYGVEV